VPTGDGVILGGVYKGLEDLLALGLSDSMPTVYAVQATGSNAISRALEQGEFKPDRKIATVADSISVGVPANGYGAVRKLKQHGGRCVQVSDEQILEAQIELSRHSGLFAEPAAAASYAGLLAVREDLDLDAVTVLLVTGSGLKDIDSASRRLTLPTGAAHG
jgi:threonine synthase